MQEKEFRPVRIERGSQGWGGPLVIQPTAEKDKIVAVTGGGIPEGARRIADLTGAEVIDGFRAPPPESEIAAVVIDCGGTARCGVYPRKHIPTINLTPVGAAGPLAQFITEDIYVSGVRPDNVNPAAEGEATTEAAGYDAGQTAPASPFTGAREGAGAGAEAGAEAAQPQMGGGFTGFIARFGRGIGGVVGVLSEIGRAHV